MRALSLFSGIGGIDLACEWAGIKTVAFCEREPFPQKVLRKHWPDVPIYDDVCTLTKERLEKDGIGTIELIHGGYPCQPFSFAGQREGKNDDRHLWPEYYRLVQEIRPRWVVGENVVGHITLGLDDVLSDLENAGYTARAFVIPAAAVGAQHRRERVFIVAHSDSEGKLQQEGYFEELWRRFSNCGENVANTNSEGLQGGAEAGDLSISWSERYQQSPRCYPSSAAWSIEPQLGRVANGIPNRMDRIKSLGNAVFPGQIYPILAAIKQIDDAMMNIR